MTTDPSPSDSFVDSLAKKREAVSYALLAFGAIMMIVSIIFFIRWDGGRPTGSNDAADQTGKEKESKAAEGQKKDETKTPYRGEDLPVAVWGLFIGLAVLGAGGWHLTRAPAVGQESHDLRIILVISGGVMGMLTALLGFALAWRRQESLLLWVNDGNLKEAQKVIGALAVLLAGLFVLFFSVRLAKPEERNSVVLRRLLYGSNSVLGGLLLLLLLSIVNVVVFLKMPDNVITTVTAFKGLSPVSKQFLQTIDDDVKITLIMPETLGRSNINLYTECLALLNECRDENKKIKTVVLSPALDADEIKSVLKSAKIQDEYKKDFGILLSYGKPDSADAFIPLEELVTPTPQGAYAFQGESRLMTELNFLSGGAKRPVVYFTQRNNEPSMDAKGGAGNVRTMRLLIQTLTDRKYVVKPLMLEAGQKIDLSDADLVVIAAPRVPFSREQTDILADYLRPKGNLPGGKLIALLPAIPSPAGDVAETGLEPLLAQYGVNVGKTRLMSFPPLTISSPQIVFGNFSIDSRRAKLPLTGTIPADEMIPFGNVRPIEALPERGNQLLNSINLLTTIPGSFSYRDEKYDSDLNEIMKELRKVDREKRAEALAKKRVTNEPVSLGVYVSEKSKEGEALKDRPRLLVIGSDMLCTDQAMAQFRSPDVFANILVAMMEFLRERPQGMNIESRALGTYSLKKDPDAIGLVYLPLGLIFIGILSLGVGVWVARRK